MDLSNSNQRKANAVVHVREDSESDLENLFDPRKNRTTLPMRERKFPPSFFKPPSSVLAAYGSRSGVEQSKDPNELGYSVSHSRAHSSPASLGLLVHHQQQQNTSQRIPSSHQRTQSYDALESEPLPHGWEGRTTATGQKYFVNHIERTTSWTHPRLKSQSLATLNANQTLGNLPDGWEQGVTPEGEVYYINHATQTTTWYDPRLNRNQSASASNFLQGQPRQTQEQQVNLRYLQFEKEKLRQRQQQIFHQEMLIQRQLTSQSDPVVSGASLINSLCQEKFSNSPSSFANAQHKRVGSADSGLDGMGSFLSPPTSEVDVLSGIDDVDMEGNIPQQQIKDSITRRSDPTNLNQINQVNTGHLPEFFDRMPATNVDDLGILEPDTDIGTGLESLQSDVLNDVDMMLSPSHTGKVKDGFLTWL